MFSLIIVVNEELFTPDHKKDTTKVLSLPIEVREQIFSTIMNVKPHTSSNIFLMFLECTNLLSLDLTSFPESKHFTIHQILSACPSLSELSICAIPSQLEVPRSDDLIQNSDSLRFLPRPYHVNRLNINGSKSITDDHLIPVIRNSPSLVQLHAKHCPKLTGN
jgi:hypothetical protein